MLLNFVTMYGDTLIFFKVISEVVLQWIFCYWSCSYCKCLHMCWSCSYPTVLQLSTHVLFLFLPQMSTYSCSCRKCHTTANVLAHAGPVPTANVYKRRSCSCRKCHCTTCWSCYYCKCNCTCWSCSYCKCLYVLVLFLMHELVLFLRQMSSCDGPVFMEHVCMCWSCSYCKCSP